MADELGANIVAIPAEPHKVQNRVYAAPSQIGGV